MKKTNTQIPQRVFLQLVNQGREYKKVSEKIDLISRKRVIVLQLLDMPLEASFTQKTVNKIREINIIQDSIMKKKKKKSKKCPRSRAYYRLKYGLCVMICFALWGCATGSPRYKLQPITRAITFQFSDPSGIQKEWEQLGGQGGVYGFAHGNRVVVPLPRSFNDREALNTLGHEVLHVLFPDVDHYDDIWEHIQRKER